MRREFLWLIPWLMLTACDDSGQAGPPVTRLATVTDCDLQRQDCDLSLPGGGSLRVRFNDRPVRAMDEFLVDMRAPGGRVRKLVARGVNMEMGYNEFLIEEVGESVYRAQVLLPICIRSRMVWDLHVYVEVGGRRFDAPFRFETHGRG